MKRYTDIRKQTDNRFLNLYEMDALTEKGAPFSYYFASRNDQDHIKAVTHDQHAEGIVIYPVLQDEPDKLVLIRQYRYPLDAWLYELPAGLIDAGETAAQAAVREMKEETGLTFIVYEGGDMAYRRAFFLGAGMTDESSQAVFGYASGTPRTDMQEATESIQVLLADRAEAKRILREERVSLRCAYLLMQFIHMDAKNPFAFLE
ncbi:MAG: NUDIX hydrolase [Lachnospiraceae bacterium]|nr:NUDIX hydrolase [Lachnospiraceae bacterium]